MEEGEEEEEFKNLKWAMNKEEVLGEGEEKEEVSFCPVCGYCEGADNMAVEEGVTIISGRPKDDLTAFVLEAGGTKYLILAFERGGLLIRPEGEITLALPKEPVEEIIFAQTGEGAAESKPEVTENKEENTLTLDGYELIEAAAGDFQ